MRAFNMIIFGATGFTGKHVIEEIHKTRKRNDANGNSSENNFTWAVAGRSVSKLENVLEEMSKVTGECYKSIAKIAADVEDYDSLRAMARQCQVVINTVGPYEFYGEEVIRACIEEGTHHIDISAESHNLTKMQIKYHKEAEAKGVYIVGSCGFDSIPNECGINYMQQHFNGDMNSIESYLYVGNNLWTNKVHFGTWQSIIRFYAEFRKLRPLLNELYPEKLPKPAHKLSTRLIHRNQDGESGWSLPFPAPDVWAVERSQNYFYIHNKQRPLQYAGYLKQSNIFLTMFIAIGACLLGLVLLTGRFGIYLMEKFPRFFSGGLISHQGPTREQMNAFDFSFTLVGKGWSHVEDANVEGSLSDNKIPKLTNILLQEHASLPDKRMVLKVSGNNPAYGATCTCLLQAALTIINESDKIPSIGGVFTPGTAFCDTKIVERLHNNGLTFDILP